MLFYGNINNREIPGPVPLHKLHVVSLNFCVKPHQVKRLKVNTLVHADMCRGMPTLTITIPETQTEIFIDIGQPIASHMSHVTKAFFHQ